jgi:pimeloyl-ACP methyl ester carboxylesterase
LKKVRKKTLPAVRTGDFECWYADDWYGPAWTNPDVLLIQAGFGRNSEYWRHWVPGLALDFRVLRRDMRAHGGSTPGDPAHEWSPEALADEVVGFLDAVGVDRVHYIGESVGGITGIVLGARYPDRFQTITLVQTPLHLRTVGDLMRGEFPTWSAAIRTLGPGGWVSRNRDPGDPHTAWERAQWDRCDAEALARLAEATAGVDVTDWVAQVGVPTLVLAPGLSPLTPLEDQFFLRTTIPEAEIDVFEGRGHDIYNQEPERCIARVRRFIEARSP